VAKILLSTICACLIFAKIYQSEVKKLKISNFAFNSKTVFENTLAKLGLK